MAAKRISPRNKSEKSIRSWERDDPEFDLQNELFRNFENHFKKKKHYDWLDVADHGRRIYTLMFHDLDQPVESDSPLDGFICAVAAQSATSAFAAIGDALGLSSESIRQAVYEFYGGQGGPVISAEEFITRAKQRTE